MIEKEAYEMTRREYADSLIQIKTTKTPLEIEEEITRKHCARITEAMNRGIKIPFEVLKDYPALHADAEERNLIQNPDVVEEMELQAPKQIPVSKWNTKQFRENCQAEIDALADGSYHCDNDFDHYIYEAAMQMVFGENIFDEYINKKIR